MMPCLSPLPSLPSPRPACTPSTRPASGAARRFAALLLLAATPLAAAGDWPWWRGPNHDGVSSERGFKTRFTAPPPKLWSANLGPAFSGISVVGDRAYTCGMNAGHQILYCLNVTDGKVVWQTPIEPEYRESNGDGTRATPTVADGRVYVVGALGRFLCCDAETGKELWSHQFHHKPEWAYSGSVLIEGDLAVTTPGGEAGALAAFDRRTGAPVWKAGDGPVGYATPYPFTFEGTRYIVGFLAKEALVVEAESGRIVWKTPWKTDWDVNAASPIFHDGHLFLSSGYRTGSAVFKLRKDGDRLSGEKLWHSKIILGKFQSAVLVDGCLYVSEEKALRCVDFLTGKERWSERGLSNGTLVVADGHIVFLSETGELQIAPLSPEKYAPTTQVEVLQGKSWTVPTLCDGRLFVRNLKQMACYQLGR